MTAPPRLLEGDELDFAVAGTAPLQCASCESLPAANPHAVECDDSWNPRWDASFDATWLTYLLAHFGEFCHASDVWRCSDPWQRVVLREKAHEVVLAAKRLGLAIESDPRLGYRIIGHDAIPRYVYEHARGEEGRREASASQLEMRV